MSNLNMNFILAFTVKQSRPRVDSRKLITIDDTLFEIFVLKNNKITQATKSGLLNEYGHLVLNLEEFKFLSTILPFLASGGSEVNTEVQELYTTACANLTHAVDNYSGFALVKAGKKYPVELQRKMTDTLIWIGSWLDYIVDFEDTPTLSVTVDVKSINFVDSGPTL